MRRKRKAVLAAAALLLAGVPATVVLKDRAEAAEWDSAERAARTIFQQRADLGAAVGREQRKPEPRAVTPQMADKLRGTYARLAAEGRKSAAVGRGWSKAEAAAHVTQMDVQDDRAKVWVNQVTTPYREGRAGEAVGPGTPFVSSHVFVFERAGDGWLLAEGATDAEHR